MPTKNIDAYAQYFRAGRSFPSFTALLDHLCMFEEDGCISLCLGNAHFMIVAGLVVRGQKVELSVREAKAPGSTTRPRHLTCSRDAVDILVAWLRSLVPANSGPLVLKLWYDAPVPLPTDAHGVAYIDADRGTYIWMDTAGREKNAPLKTIRRNSQQVGTEICYASIVPVSSNCPSL